MNNIALYGAGGFGREVACLIRMINDAIPSPHQRWNLIGFFDDGAPQGTRNEYGEILGNMYTLNAWPEKLAVAIAVGHPKHLKHISENITNPNIWFPNLIAPDTVFYDHNNYKIGKGNIICIGCTISCNVAIGNFNVLNCFISLGHDASIGNCNAVMPGARISGYVEMGDYNFLGTESVIIQGKHIGNDTVVGANSVIMRNTKDGFTYAGNPAVKMSF